MTRARSLSKLSNPATFTVDTDNNIGVNSTSPKEKLNIVGVISATSFFGDGSGLTSLNVGAGGTWINYDSNTGVTTTKKVKIQNDLEVTGVVTATSFSGDGSSLTGIAATDNVSTSTLNVVGFSTLAGATFSGIATFADDINLGDSDKIHLGADQDLDIYHNNSHAFVENGTGNLYLRSSAGTSINIEPAAGAAGIIANAGDDVELYHNANKKLETTAGGVSITGTSTCTGSVQVGSGQSFGANGPTAVYYGDGSNLTNLNIPAGFTELDAALFN